MSTITRLPLQVSVSKAAPFVGAIVDVSGVPAQGWTLVVHVSSFAGTTARIEVSDSVDNFAADDTAVYVAHIVGALTPSADRAIRLPWYDLSDARFGAVGSKVRVTVTSITGGAMVYDANIEF